MRTARAVLLKAVTDTAARATSFLTFPLLAAEAGTDGYGAWLQMLTVVSLVVPFASFGLTVAALRFFATDDWTRAHRGLLRRAGLASVLCAVVIGTVIAATAPALEGALLNGSSGHAALFRAAGILLVATTLEQFVLNTLRARGKLIRYSLLELTQTGVLLVGIVLILPPLGLTALAVFVSLVRLAVISLAYLVLASERSSDTAGEHASLRDLARFGIPISVSLMGLWVMNLGDRLVVGAVLSASDLGRYGAVYALVSIMALANQAVSLPALPRIMRAATKSPEAVAAEVRLFHRHLLVALVPVAMYVVLIGPQSLELLGGAGFEVDATLVALVAAGLFLNNANGLAHYALTAYERTVALQNVVLVAGVLNLALNIVTVPVFGLEGAAASSLATFMLLEAFLLRTSNRDAPIVGAYAWRTLARVTAGTLVAVVVSALLPLGDASWTDVAVRSGVYWAISATALILLRELTMSDWATLRSALPQVPWLVRRTR